MLGTLTSEVLRYIAEMAFHFVMLRPKVLEKG